MKIDYRRKVNYESKTLYDELNESSEDEFDDIICFRCGRPGHLSTTCYAKKHKKGHHLD
jgi:hypothetical protein